MSKFQIPKWLTKIRIIANVRIRYFVSYSYFREPHLEIGNSARMRGQGLLEAVIALGIIITGIVAALTLAIGSLSGAGASESRLIAANLAREGIEIARNVRDSNWVAVRSWDTGMEAVGEANAYAPRWNVDTQQMELAPLSSVTTQGRLYAVPETGMVSPSDTGQATRFFRRIILTNLCTDGGSACGQSDRVGMQVQSDVAWEQRGVLPQIPQVRVVGELYKWR